MNTAIYTRISQDRQGHEAGVTRQRTDCLQRADDLELHVAREFSDNDTSAHGKRPGYTALLAAIADRDIDRVIVWRLDRLYRRPIELEQLIDLVENGSLSGGITEVTSGDLDLNSVSGRLAARILVSVAKGESETASERIRRAQREAALAGRPHGGRRQFGYTKEYELDPVEAPALVEAARWVADGGSVSVAAAVIREQGLTTPTGKPMSVATLRYMLASPAISALRVYKGEIVAEGQWEPIIERDEWNQLQAVLSANPTPGPRRTTSAHLNGFSQK
jgi:site-specific DNA recombinase